MNKRMISLMAAALALLSASGQVEFIGVGDHPVIEETPDPNTDLKKIFVVFDTDGVGMSFNSSTGEPATWETFYYRDGHLVIEPVPGIRWNGMKTTLPQVIPNIGYKIVEGSRAYFYWVVNYADYYLELNDLFFNEEAPCNLLTLTVDGRGDAIPYYTVDGDRRVLDRDIKLTYDTQVRDDSTDWEPQQVVESFAALDQGIEIVPPLCDTRFLLTGDRFLEQWNIAVGAESDDYYTNAVSCGATTWQERDQDDGSTSSDGELDNGLGGSAPARIIFTGYPSSAVVYRVWEMATDPDFENVILQFNQDEVDYTFNETGTFYMRYMVANASGSCEAYSDVFTISMNESYIPERLPNIFSPGTTEGVNDIWKVVPRPKSILEFHCWIYNRWGRLIYEFTDPYGGWDGRYRGKLVDPGVYYYVLTAVGSDGQKFNRRGDINILHYKGRRGTSSPTGTGG